MTRIQNTTRIGLLAVALAGGMNLASSAFAVEALPRRVGEDVLHATHDVADR